MRRLLVLLTLLVLPTAGLSAQDHDHATPPAAPLADGLVVVLPGGVERTVTGAQLATLPRVRGRAEAHGHAWTWEGVELRGALRLAGLASIDTLKGPALGQVLVFVGADGYRAVLALAELDATIGNRRAVLVDREDGAPLTAARLPRRVIIEGDGRPSRWVTQLVRIEVVALGRR